MHALSYGIMLLICSCGSALASQARVALVVGNSEYRYVKQLANPKNDAEDVARSLALLGFDVVTAFDASRAEMDKAFAAFEKKLTSAADAVFYYAGHGVQVSGVNYMVPVDATDNASALNVEMRPLQIVQMLMERHSTTNVIFLDACRNNPFTADLTRSLGSRLTGDGLAPVDVGVGTLISFSTQPNNVASDGHGRNSPFTAALVAALQDPRDDLNALLIKVRNQVRVTTGNKQVPWEHSSLLSKYYFRGASVSPEGGAISPVVVSKDARLSRGGDHPASVSIGTFDIEADVDKDLEWLKTKVERNFVDYFVDKGLRTFHRSSTSSEADAAAMEIVGSIERGSAGTVELRAQVLNPRHEIVAAASVDAPFEVWQRHYKSIPDALIFSLHVSPFSLAKTETERWPTVSPIAMLYYSEAQRWAKTGNLEKVTPLLEAALAEDPRFAMAYWAMGQVADARGAKELARTHIEKADLLDPDHPRKPFVTNPANPLPRLRTQLQSAAWVSVGAGADMKVAGGSDDQARIFAWRFDPGSFRMVVAASDGDRGATAHDLRLKTGAVLAINGGFFDIDRQSRLTPSGLLVVDGKQVSPLSDARKGGSGVVLQRAGGFEILPAASYIDSADVSAAIQAGPLVVDPGGVNGIRRNDLDRQHRSVVCREQSGKLVVFSVTGGLSLFEVGELASSAENDGGFGCERALNLDGGPSTQVSFEIGSHSMEIAGRWRVPNALTVVPLR